MGSVEEEIVYHDDPEPLGMAFGAPRVSIEEQVIYHDDPSPLFGAPPVVVHHGYHHPAVVHHHGPSPKLKCSSGGCKWFLIACGVLLVVLIGCFWWGSSSTRTYYPPVHREPVMNHHTPMVTRTVHSGYTPSGTVSKTVSVSDPLFGGGTTVEKTHRRFRQPVWNAPPPGTTKTTESRSGWYRTRDPKTGRMAWAQKKTTVREHGAFSR